MLIEKKLDVQAKNTSQKGCVQHIRVKEQKVGRKKVLDETKHKVFAESCWVKTLVVAEFLIYWYSQFLPLLQHMKSTYSNVQ